MKKDIVYITGHRHPDSDSIISAIAYALFKPVSYTHLRDNPEHVRQIQELGIDYIDLVCVNLYPFKQTVQKPGVTHEEIIENIDIGGPSMLRSASKNYRYIPVIVDPSDYAMVLNELRENGETRPDTRELLAAKVFRHTAA